MAKNIWFIYDEAGSLIDAVTASSEEEALYNAGWGADSVERMLGRNLAVVADLYMVRHELERIRELQVALEVVLENEKYG